MLGSYVHPESEEEILISADSRGYHWINAAAEERLTFDLNVEDFKLTPAEGSGHEISVTFETDDDGVVTGAVREGVTYQRLIGTMESKVREEGVHLALPEVERKAGGNIHAFVMNVEDAEDWRDFSVLGAIATSAKLNGGVPTVVVDDTSPADDDAIQNLLDRLQPNQVTIFRCEDEKLQGQVKGSDSASVTERTCNNLKELNDFIATTWAGEIKEAVVCSTKDYGNALLATSLACLVSAPLFVTEKLEDFMELPDFGTYPLLVVGEDLKADDFGPWEEAKITCIPNLAKAMSFIKERSIAVNYIALTNPLDRKTKLKLSLTAPIYACVHGGLVVPLSNVTLQKAGALDGEPLTKVKEQLLAVYEALGKPRFLNLVGNTESVPACKTTLDVNNCKDYAVTDYQYATCKFNLEDAHEIAVGRCYTDSSTAGFLLATRSVNYPVLRAAGDWKDKIVDAGLWGFPELRKIFYNANFKLAEVQKDEMSPLHRADFESKKIEASAVLHKDHSGWAGLGQCMGRHSPVMFAPCVMVSLGCHAAGIDEGIPSCASRVMARGGVCFTGAARCPTAIATLWSVAFFNELLDGQGRSLGEANQMAHNKFMAHRKVFLGDYTLVNRFTLGDPALRPYANVQNDVAKMARHSLSAEGTVAITGPDEWSMVPMHPDQLKEWKYEGSLFVPVCPGCAPDAQWCGGGYDAQTPYYQLAIKVPGNVKGVVMTAATYNKGGDDITAEDGVSADDDPVCGDYECSQYVDKGNANDWHYVKIERKDDGGYKWTNKAGVSWSLDAESLDIKEDCPYFEQGRHNEPKRNLRGIVTSMNFGGEAYNRVGIGSPEMAEAKKMWWQGETHDFKDLNDGNKLLLLPLKMIQYDQKEGKVESFLKSCTLKVVGDDATVDLVELNKAPTAAERGGGRGIALAMQNRAE